MSFGKLLPGIVAPPPGPRSRLLSRGLAAEAPGVNTLSGGAPSLVWEEARGANVRDVDGNVFIDLTSGFGVASVGHRHPRVVAAVRRQAGRLLHGLGDVHAHPLRIELAARLARLAPIDTPLDAALEDVPQVFFAVSGAEAVEIALKTALAATASPGVVAFEPSYHGLTLGALAVTSRPEFRAPFAAHLHSHVRRLPFGCPPSLIAAELRRYRSHGSHGSQGRHGVRTVIVEPIVGREGVLLPPAGWLAEVSSLCRAAGALLIADEIFTGFGRTGSLFAVEAEGVRPDLLCCGKALGGGLPIAAVLGRRSLFRCWQTAGEALHTSTFLANPLACAAALAVLDIFAGEGLSARAAELGSALGRRLAGWPDRFPSLAAARGRGFLWGLEMQSRAAAARTVAAALGRGLLVLAGGPQGRVVQLVPPLTITKSQLRAALDILEEVLATL